MKSLLNAVIKKLFGNKIPKIRENYAPYVEKDTECDECYKKNECVEKGYLVDCTLGQDTRQHYTKGRRCICLKGCENLMEMKLSEILEVGGFEETKAFLRKAIDQLGDITFREFYQEERCLEVINFEK